METLATQAKAIAKYTLSYKSLISYFSSSHAKIAVCPGDNERNSLSLVRLMKSSTFGLGLNLLEVRVENQFLCKETKNSFSGLRQESSFRFFQRNAPIVIKMLFYSLP